MTDEPNGNAIPPHSDIDQLKMGTAVIGLCIAQVLSEENPALTKRLHDRAELWYEQLAGRGDTHAAEMLYMFARALLGPTGQPASE
jgi:hypothetical protein